MSSDFAKIRSVENALKAGNIESAWDTLVWVFQSTDLDEEGFFQTASRLGISSEQFKTRILDQYPVAREFIYGKETIE